MRTTKYQKLISLRIDQEKYEQLEEMASNQETSTASLIRLAISNYLKQTTPILK